MISVFNFCYYSLIFPNETMFVDPLLGNEATSESKTFLKTIDFLEYLIEQNSALY